MKLPASTHARTSRRQGTAPALPAPVLRRDQLRNRLPEIVDALNRRRADLFPEGFIDDYVALDWLEWRGGALHVTVTGANICNSMRVRSSA